MATTRTSNSAPSSKFPVLFRAIAAGDVARVSRMLDDYPGLAVEPARTGATRGAAASFFIKEIAHNTYAGDTALHLAAAAHQPRIARDLMKRGADVRARNRRGAEPLHYACDGSPGSRHWNAAAQAETIESLLDTGADLNATDHNGVMPLHRAIRTRSSAAVRVLLDHGANPRQMNGRGSTPMQLALMTTGRSGSGSEEARAEQEEIVRLLLAHGAQM